MLGSPTTWRFVLLVVLFVAGGAGLSAGIAADFATGTVNNSVGCALASGLNPEAGMRAGWAGSIMSSTPALQDCWARYVPNTTWVPLVVVPALLLAAAAVYLALPRWKGRRSRFVAVKKVDVDGRLCADLEALAAEAELAGRVEFGVDPGAVTAGAVVFGTRRRALVRLHGGLLVTHRTDPGRFRAVVLHELAHVRNGDVGITYATVALWRVFLAAVLLPAAVNAVYGLFTGRFPAVWHMPSFQVFTLVEVALIVVMVYLTRADILRTREMHADLTARRWKVHPDDVIGKREPGGRANTTRRRALVAFGELWRTHPSWSARGRALKAPDALFGVAALPMFVTGLAAAIFTHRLGSALSTAPGPVETVPEWLAAGLITAIGGVTVWRAVLYALARDRTAPSGWLAGFWLGAGLAVGELVMGAPGSENGWLPPYPETLAILVITVMSLTAWTAQYARLRIRTYRGRSLRLAMLIGLIPSWLVLVFALSWWKFLAPVHGWLTSGTTLLTSYGLPTDRPPPLLIRFDTVIAVSPGAETTFASLWWAIPLLWLLPLALWVRRRPKGAPRWLDRVTSPNVPDEPVPDRLPRLWPIVRAGLLGGLASGVGLLAARVGVDTVRGLGHPAVESAAAFVWIVLVITAAMLVTAAVVGATSPDCPLLAALIASGVVALVGTLIACLQLTLDGCLGPANVLVTDQCAVEPKNSVYLFQEWIGYVLSAATLACLGVAALAQAARTLLRRLRSTTAAMAIVDAPARTGRHRTAAAILTVAIAVIATVTIQTTAATHATESSVDPTQVFRSGPTPSAVTQQQQIGAWARYGGLDLIRRVHTLHFTTLPAAVTELANTDDTTFESTQNRVVPPVCAEVAVLTSDANHYFDVPIAAGQQIWAALVNALNSASTACRRAEQTHDPYSFLAVHDDIRNAGFELNTLLQWIGPKATPGAQPIITPFGYHQTLVYHGLTYRFTAANLSIHPAGTTTGQAPPAARTATLNVEACLTGTPPNTKAVGGHPGSQPWRLVFPDGTKVAPARTWSPDDVDGPLYPPTSQGEFTTTGDCVAGLVPFDIPAAQQGTPQQVLFTPTSTPTTLAWSVPDTLTTDWHMLGVAYRVTDGAPADSLTVTGYSVRRASPTDRIATITVVACLPYTPASATAATSPWKLLLANGVTASPLRPGAADAASPLYPDGSASVGAHHNCRSGSILFDIPAAEEADPVRITYHTDSVNVGWPMTPPSQ